MKQVFMFLLGMLAGFFSLKIPVPKRFRIRDPWEYGTLNSLIARRHVRSGLVQMKRPLGWINFHPDHWSRFEPANESEGKQ